MNISDTIKSYIDLRSQLDDKRKEYKDFESMVKEQMEMLETQILEECNTTGVESFKTAYGTAFKTTKTYARIFDTEARNQYIKETGDFALITAHVNKTHVQELLDTGVDPSEFGGEFTTEQAIQIRKPTK